MSDADNAGNWWSAIEQAYKDVSIYDGPDVLLKGFSRWPEHVVNLLAAHWVRSEVFNGGLIQFFQNDTGVLAPESVRGLNAIGLPEAANVVADAMRLFGEPYPRDRDTRLWMTESRSWTDEWDALDRRFNEALGEFVQDASGVGKDDFDRAADAYAAKFRK